MMDSVAQAFPALSSALSPQKVHGRLYVLKHGSVGELVVKLKRQTQSRRNRTGKRGMMSEVPDNVLLYIMSFMSTRDACSWRNGGEKVLRICNSALSSLEIYSYGIFNCDLFHSYKIALSTPNLNSFTVEGSARHQLSVACNLSLLGPVSICMLLATRSIVIRWLQGLANVKMLTLTSVTLKAILEYDFLDPSSEGLQPPCFVNLESLKIKRKID
eukprot:XP_006600088.1 uncharacterized protein LOC102663386 [Glycine max]